MPISKRKRSYVSFDSKDQLDQIANRRYPASQSDRTGSIPTRTKKERLLLDRLSKNIISELVQNPNLTSDVIARAVKSPLSTVQRRRTALERSILTKSYNLDMSIFGWRIADLMIELEKGDPYAVAKSIIRDNNRNIINASLRIGSPRVNIVAQICYRSSKELHEVLQNIKAHDKVNHVEWSEIVQVITKSNADALQNILDLS
ncbi:MAG TPA: winged helix-turn-helix transcriptional regulator [Nitrososphaeraceae archaeon]|nr:winged helix-turn-helix transcriptional regulator [Nitrososphaeraceae archaeon]